MGEQARPGPDVKERPGPDFHERPGHGCPLGYRYGAHSLAGWEFSPAGSDAYASYFSRIVDGPNYAPRQALRLNQPLHAAAAA